MSLHIFYFLFQNDINSWDTIATYASCNIRRSINLSNLVDYVYAGINRRACEKGTKCILYVRGLFHCSLKMFPQVHPALVERFRCKWKNSGWLAVVGVRHLKNYSNRVILDEPSILVLSSYAHSLTISKLLMISTVFPTKWCLFLGFLRWF